MVTLLAIYLILCLLSTSCKGWVENRTPEMRNDYVVTIFTRQPHPWCHVHFLKYEKLECEIKVPLGYYYVFYKTHIYNLY